MFTTSFQPQCSFSGKFEQIPHWQGQCNAGLMTAQPYYVPQVPEIRYGYTPGETVSQVAPPTLIADSAYKQHNTPLVVTTASIHPNHMTAYRDSQPMEQLYSPMAYADQKRVPRQTRSTAYTAAPPSADKAHLSQAILQGHQQKRYPESDVFTEEDEFLIEQRIMRRTATYKALQQLDDELGKIELLMEKQYEEGRRCLDRAFKNSEPDKSCTQHCSPRSIAFDENTVVAEIKSIIMPDTQSSVETPVLLPVLQIDYVVEMENVTDLATEPTEKATIVLPDSSIYHVATVKMSNIIINRNIRSSELMYTEIEDVITPTSVGKIGENATLDEIMPVNSELYASTDSPGGTHATPAILSATLPRSSDYVIYTCVPSFPQEPAYQNTVDDHKHDEGNSTEKDVSDSTISEPLWSPSGQPTTRDNEYIATCPSTEGNISASNAGATNLEPLRTPIGPTGDTNNEPIDADGTDNNLEPDTSFTILEPLRSPGGEASNYDSQSVDGGPAHDGITVTYDMNGGATILEPLRSPSGGPNNEDSNAAVQQEHDEGTTNNDVDDGVPTLEPLRSPSGGPSGYNNWDNIVEGLTKSARGKSNTDMDSHLQLDSDRTIVGVQTRCCRQVKPPKLLSI